MILPTARVRSAGVLHASGCDDTALDLLAREGDGRRDAVAVKETILQSAQRKSVSMPSALCDGVGAGAGLLVLRAGSVKLRRPWSGSGACSSVFVGACEVMTGISDVHVCVSDGSRHGARRRARGATGLLVLQVWKSLVG